MTPYAKSRERLIHALALAALGLLPTATWALDFLDSYQAALTEDANYRAAQAQAQANREVVPMAQAQLYPNLSSNYSTFRNDLNRTQGGRSLQDQYPSSNFALTLRQPLYRPVQTTGLAQSKIQLEGVEATLGQAQQDTAVRVSQAYFNVLLAKEGLAVVLAQKEAMANQLDAARKAFAAGTGARTDIDEAQARLDISRAQEISARQQIDQTRHQLSILVNRPVNSIHVLQAERLPLRPMQPEGLEPWLERAEAASPELKSLRAEVNVARLEVERLKAGHLPTVDLIMQHSRNTSDNVLSPDARFVNNQIGLQASLPIYAGGYVNAQVRSAQSSLTESEERLEAARRKLATEVRKQFQAVQEGVAKVRALEQAERSADQAVLSSQMGFRAGTRTRLDILNAEQQRSQTRLELSRERINFVLARAQLLALCGELGLDEVRSINSWLVPEASVQAVAVKTVPSDKPAQNVALAPAATAIAAPAAPAAPVTAAAARAARDQAQATQAIDRAIQQWAAAWSRKDFGAYLEAYATDFKVPSPQSRKQWEKSRKALIVGKNVPIELQVSDLDIQVAEGKAAARFRQDYKAGKTVSTVRKQLVLVKSGPRWLILEEKIL